MEQVPESAPLSPRRILPEPKHTTASSYRHTPAPPLPLSLFTVPSNSSSTNASTTALPVSVPSISSRRSIVTHQPRVFSPPSSRLPPAKGTASLPTHPALWQMALALSSPPPPTGTGPATFLEAIVSLYPQAPGDRRHNYEFPSFVRLYAAREFRSLSEIVPAVSRVRLP